MWVGPIEGLGTEVCRAKVPFEDLGHITPEAEGLLFFTSTIIRVKQELSMGDRGHNRHGSKRGGGCCAPFAGAGTSSNTMWPGRRSTSVPSGVIIHPDVWSQYMGQNLGGLLCPSPFWGKLSHHVTQCRLGRGLPPYQVVS